MPTGASGRVRLQVARMREFYSPHVEADVEHIFDQCGLGTDVQSQTKSILLQAKRLIELGDGMLVIRPDRDALALFWYVICAESVSKIESGAGPGTGSHLNVQRFFKLLVPASEQIELGRSFLDAGGNELAIRRGVAALYEVRCAIAHDGEYWDFRFPKRGARLISESSGVHTTISRERLRRLIILGALNAARMCVQREA